MPSRRREEGDRNGSSRQLWTHRPAQAKVLLGMILLSCAAGQPGGLASAASLPLPVGPTRPSLALAGDPFLRSVGVAGLGGTQTPSYPVYLAENPNLAGDPFRRSLGVTGQGGTQPPTYPVYLTENPNLGMLDDSRVGVLPHLERISRQTRNAARLTNDLLQSMLSKLGYMERRQQRQRASMEEGAREVRLSLGPGAGCCTIFFALMEMAHQYFLSNAIWGFICTLPHCFCWLFSFCYHWHVPPPLISSQEVLDLEGDSSEEEYEYEDAYGPPRWRNPSNFDQVPTYLRSQRNQPTWGRLI